MDMRLLVLGAFLVGGCAQDSVRGDVRDNETEEVDEEGPLVEHDPIETAQPYGQEIPLEAIVSDASDVWTVEIVYQQETSSEWKTSAMTEVGPTQNSEGDEATLWQGRISGDHIASGGMRYFIRATDWSENANMGCAPEDCEEDAWHFKVTAQ